MKKNKIINGGEEDFEFRQDNTSSWITESIIQTALQERDIHVRGMITPETSYFVNRMFTKLRQIDLLRGVGYPITISLNTEGGFLSSTFSIISKMREFQKMGYIIKTTTTDIAMSCGALILMCGTKGYRSAQEFSEIMYHQPSTVSLFKQTYEDSLRDTEEFGKLWNKIRELTIEYTLIKDEWLVDEIQKRNVEKYLWANEAIELGIIDFIVGFEGAG